MLTVTQVAAFGVVVGWALYALGRQVKKKAGSGVSAWIQPPRPMDMTAFSELAIWSVYPLFVLFVELTASYENTEVIRYIVRNTLALWLGFSIVTAIVVPWGITGRILGVSTEYLDRGLEKESKKTRPDGWPDFAMVRDTIREIWIRKTVYHNSKSSRVLERIAARDDELGTMARATLDEVSRMPPAGGGLAGLNSRPQVALQITLTVSLMLIAACIAVFW